jgi:hypothetical protein
MGEWNQEIVTLASETGYIAVRDTQKDNTWRDRRPVTVSLDDSYIWHMHYYKPELATPEELKHALGYTNWWQIEENFVPLHDNDGDIQLSSSLTPTDTSYAVVWLYDVDDSIMSNFLLSRDATYTLELMASAGEVAPSMLVDQTPLDLTMSDPENCVAGSDPLFCSYFGTIALEEGEHTLTIVAGDNGIPVDKFRIFRELPLQKRYSIQIVEYAERVPEYEPQQAHLAITVNEVRTFEKPTRKTNDMIPVGLAVGGITVLALGVLYHRKKGHS